VAVAVLLALPLLFLRANLASSDHLNAIDRFILRLSAPLQAGLTTTARGIGRAWSSYVALVHVRQDNARLVEENARLRSELIAAQKAAARGAGLEKLLGLRGALKADTLAARIIGVETSAFFRVVRVRLDRGEVRAADGSEIAVKPGMAVLAAEGVVGRVQRVFGPYCDVLLAVDPKSSIDVVVARTGGRGVLKGIPGDNRYRMRIEYLERKDEVAEGDMIVTSGLGGWFPRDLPIGRIVRVAKKDFGLYQEAEVAPLVDFGKLSEVLVVVPKEASAPSPPPPPTSASPSGGAK
jgi:rod shape-determining protein MreC